LLAFGRDRWPLLVLPLALFVRMALNAMDGMLAREYAMQTRGGAVLNEMGDVLSDLFLYVPLALLPGFSAVLVLSVSILAVLSEFAGVLAVQIGSSRRYDGPMGKSDRAFVFGAVGLALGLGLKPDPWLGPLLAALVALLMFTIYRRLAGALREAKP
jgi:CDP-diacylglycerol---glycerol-3-phosphate 3-phosphatidyltransferase